MATSEYALPTSEEILSEIQANQDALGELLLGESYYYFTGQRSWSDLSTQDKINVVQADLYLLGGVASGATSPGLTVSAIEISPSSAIVPYSGVDAATAFDSWAGASGAIISGYGSASTGSTSVNNYALGQPLDAVGQDETANIYGMLAMPWNDFVASASSTMGVSIDSSFWENESLVNSLQEALDPYFWGSTSIMPAVVGADGQVYFEGEAMDALKEWFDEQGIGGDTNVTVPDDNVLSVPSFIYSQDTSFYWTESTSPTYNYAQYFTGVKAVARFYGYGNEPTMILYANDVNSYTFGFDSSSISREDAVEKAMSRATSTTLYSSYTYDNKTVYFSYNNVSGQIQNLEFSFDGYNSFRVNDFGKFAWLMIYGGYSGGGDFPEGTSAWTGDSVEYNSNGIGLIESMPITGDPIIRPFYPVQLPVGDPGVTNSPLEYPNPQAPSEIPDISRYTQTQVTPEEFPEPQRQWVKDNPDKVITPYQNAASVPIIINDPTYDPSSAPTEENQSTWDKIQNPPSTPPQTTGESPDPTFPATSFAGIIPDPGTAGQGSPGMIHVYNPSPAQLNAFGAWLWVTYADATIDKIWNNPFDGVISAHELYCTPTDGAIQNIRSGFLVSTASAPVVASRYKTINCGSIVIPEYWGNYLDYSPYTKCHIYLPFIGIVELDSDDIIGHAVNVTYRVDTYNGSCIAQITVAKTDYNNTVYQFSGNCAVDIPLSGGSQASIKAGMISAAAYGLGSTINGIMNGAAFGGGAGALLGGATGIVSGAAGAIANVVSQKSSVQHSGSFGASYGAMGIKIPYLIIRRPIQKVVPNYNLDYGYPAHERVVIGAMSGYLRVKEVNVQSATATDDEKKKIEQLLKGGVYVT